MKILKKLKIKGCFSMSVVTLFLLLSSAKCNSDDGDINPQEDPIDIDDSGDTTDGDTGQDPFTLVTRITPTGIQEGDFFGYALAATADFTAVSAPFDSDKGTRSGAVYVFKRDGLVFESTSYIIYPESATTEDHFGWSLSFDEETLIIGAPKNDKNGENAGMAYVYKHVGNNQWILMKELVPPHATAGQEFGSAVSIDNGTVVVASKFDSDNYYDEGDLTNAGGIAQGSAFIFEEANDWKFIQKLVPGQGTGHLWDAFGNAVLAYDNTIVIGAPGTDNTTYKALGSVYVFNRTNEQWQERARIEASDGEKEDFFGSGLSFDGLYLAVASPGSYNSLMPNQNQPLGAVYIFSESANEWNEEAKLVPEGVVPDDHFGAGGIALHDNYVVVGGPWSEEVTKSNGSVYFFDRGPGWYESHEVIAPDPLNEDLFGSSLAVSNNLIFVGAHRRCNETGCWAGALYFIK